MTHNADDNASEITLKLETKKLYSLLKDSKQDSNGIASLKTNRQTFSSDPDKAKALNYQCHSIFSPKSQISLKSLTQKTLHDLRDSGMNLLFKPSQYKLMQMLVGGYEKLLNGLTVGHLANR